MGRHMADSKYISARTSDGGLRLSLTGTSFCRLDPARLACLMRGVNVRMLNPAQITDIVTHSDVAWD